MLEIITTALKFYFRLSTFTRLQLAGQIRVTLLLFLRLELSVTRFPLTSNIFDTLCIVIIVKDESFIEKMIFLDPLTLTEEQII